MGGVAVSGVPSCALPVWGFFFFFFFEGQEEFIGLDVSFDSLSLFSLFLSSGKQEVSVFLEWSLA